MRKLMLPLLAGLIVLGSLAPVAAAETWVIDTSHSSVSFEVRHFFSMVPGRFGEYEGMIQFDPDKPTEASVEATIQMASVDTDNEKRDEHLRSPDFFDVDSHPTMTFKSKKVEKQGEALKVTGDLTLHGVTKEVVLDVNFLGAMASPWGGNVAGFTASTKIDRKDFGIVWNKTLDAGGTLLGDEVAIQINIEATTPKEEGE
jgi:polyisoprenoid-binding protein YceI